MTCAAYLVDERHPRGDGADGRREEPRTVTGAPYPTKVFADEGSTIASLSRFAGLGAHEVGDAIATARSTR